MPDQLIAQQVGKKIKLVWTYAPAPSWPDANGFIYNEGEFEDMWVPGYSSGSGVQSKESDHLFLRGGTSFSSRDERTYVTDKMIDVTNYNALKIEWQVLAMWRGLGALIVSTNKMGNYLTYDAQLAQTFGTGGRVIGSLDISSLNGNYYIRIHAVSDPYGEAPGIIEAYKVWLE